MMQIACSRSHLRPLVLDDAASLADHANDRGIWENLRDRFPHPYTVADAVAYIDQVARRPLQTSFGIIVDGQAAGSISLMVGDDIARRSAEVGYWIGRAYWGRGIMAEVLEATTRCAFDHLQLARVFALPFARTQRSVRVLEKAGYVLEGVMRHSAIKDGMLLDQILYAAYADSQLLSPDYRTRAGVAADQ